MQAEVVMFEINVCSLRASWQGAKFRRIFIVTFGALPSVLGMSLPWRSRLGYEHIHVFNGRRQRVFFLNEAL